MKYLETLKLIALLTIFSSNSSAQIFLFTDIEENQPFDVIVKVSFMHVNSITNYSYDIIGTNINIQVFTTDYTSYPAQTYDQVNVELPGLAVGNYAISAKITGRGGLDPGSRQFSVPYTFDWRNSYLFIYALDGELPHFKKVGNQFQYIHPQRSDDANLIYTVEACTNLTNGIWNTMGLAAGTNITGGVLNYVTNNIQIDNPQKYIKLNVRYEL